MSVCFHSFVLLNTPVITHLQSSKGYYKWSKNIALYFKLASLHFFTRDSDRPYKIQPVMAHYARFFSLSESG